MTEEPGGDGTGRSEAAASPQSRVGVGFVAAYLFAYLGMWMALLTPVTVSLALKVQQVDPQGGAGSLSLVLGVGAFFALVANPFFGKLSDRTTSRFGMRRPWLLGGAVVGTLGLLLVSIAQSVPVILVGWCVAQLAFNALLAAIVALLPDQVPRPLPAPAALPPRGVLEQLLGESGAPPRLRVGLAEPLPGPHGLRDAHFDETDLRARAVSGPAR